MSRSWNGLSLQSEFSALLGDGSDPFKLKVLGWMNDILEDICNSFDWPFMRALGLQILTALAEEQNLFMPSPGAPTLAALAGGSLTSGSSFKVLVTYYESVSGVESQAGTESSSITASGSDLSITVSAIPTSSNTLVTARRIYLQKDSGDWLYYSIISDNTTTTTTITSEPSSSARQPPDHQYFRKIDGEPFFESSSQLTYKPIDQLRLCFQGTFASGTPHFYSPLKQDRLLMYPKPSSALTLKFYYYRFPNRLYALSTDFPDAPVFIKPALWQGVKWKGYEYRDRQGKDKEEEKYERAKARIISMHGTPRQGASVVRDVVGDIDGNEVD